jgi:CheY-like chemotaxis protein
MQVIIKASNIAHLYSYTLLPAPFASIAEGAGLLNADQQAFPPGVVNTLYGAGRAITPPLMKSGMPFAIVQDVIITVEPIQKTHYAWDGPKLKILFVEDNPINITYSMALFKKLGFDVVLAENGRDGLAALEQGAFDLVLMDIQMPIMNGEVALRAIRTNEQGKSHHLPVIALTAYSLRGDRERFLEEGFDGYVSKPMAVDELIEEMKRVLDV